MLLHVAVLAVTLAAPAARPPAPAPAKTTAAPPPAKTTTAPPPAPAAAAPVAPPAAAPARPATAAKVRVAVMDVTSLQGVPPGTAAILTNIVVGDVARAGFDTVSKSDIASIIGFEKQKQMLGCAEDASCIAELGGALGVDYMLTGQVGQIGSQLHLSLQLVETRKSRVAARVSRFSDPSEDALVKVTREATAEVLAPALARLPAAARPAPLPVAAAPAKAGPSRRPAWIAFGVGAALAAGGAVTGSLARSKYSDLEAKQGTPGYAAAYESERSSIRTTALAADVMFGGAVVAAGVGTWLWFRKPSEPRQVTVVPVVAPGAAALAVAATF